MTKKFRITTDKRLTMVLLGLCSGGTIHAQTVASLIGIMQTTPVAISFQTGGYKPHNMNQLVKEAQRLGATHLLNMDSDMIIPPDALDKLLKADKDIVGAKYMARGEGYSTLKFEKDGQYVPVNPDDFPKELFECAAVGLGFTLINMRVFEKLPKPYFYTYEKSDDREDFATEDIVFCQDARKAGFSVWCDPSIEVGHIGQYIY